MKKYQGQMPSRLADLNGNRRSGGTYNYTLDKPAKRRFNIGEKFEHDGSVWELIYMYRVSNEKGIWFHCLEEIGKISARRQFIQDAIVGLGAGATTDRI